MERKFEEFADASELDVEIWGPDGFAKVSKIGKTRPYEVWETKVGKRTLRSADDHIVMTVCGPKAVKDLEPGWDAVLVESGISVVDGVKRTDRKEHMFDVEIVPEMETMEIPADESLAASSYEGRLCSIKCSDLRPGDVVKTSEGFREIETMERKEDKLVLGVNRNGRLYYANGIASHNTLFLCHFSCAFARQGKNVLYFTLEMSDVEIFKRLEANLLDIDIGKIDSKEEKDVEARRKAKEKLLEEYPDIADLKVAFFPSDTCTVAMMEEKIIDLEKNEGWKPDVIVVDQINSMAGMGSSDSLYVLYKHIAIGLKSLAQKYNVIVLAGTQPNREGIKKEGALGMGEVGDSVAIPQYADIFLTFKKNTKLSMAGEEHRGGVPKRIPLLCRLDKDRVGGGQKIFHLTSNVRKMRLEDADEEN